ncbi:EMC6-like membrane protein [Haloarcula salina]
MATETADGMSSHMRGLTVTTLTAVAGIAAAFGSNALATSASDPQGVLVVAVAVAAQFPILRVIGIDTDDLSTKDFLYIGFMTFALWFVSWGILLTTGA